MGASQRVTVLGPNLPAKLADQGTLHVHAEGCADIKRRYPRFEVEQAWTFEADSILAVVADIYEPGNFDYDINDEASREPYVSDVHFAPCVHLPFEGAAQLPDLAFAAPLTHPGGVPAQPTPEPLTETQIGLLADRIASEAVRRIVVGESVGEPSLYNFIREAAIDSLGKGFGS